MLLFLMSAFLFFLPFQFAVSFSSGLEIPTSRLLALVLVIFAFALALARRQVMLPPLFLTGPALGFLFFTTISILWSPEKEFALRKAVFLWNFLPLMYVFWMGLYDVKARTVLVSALVFGANMAAVIGLGFFMAQFLFGVSSVFHFLLERILPFFLGEHLSQSVAQYPSLLVNIGGETILRVTAFFPDPHVAAFYFGISGFLALGYSLEQRSRFFFVSSLLLFLAHILTFSRGGYVGLLAGFLVFFVLQKDMLRTVLQPKILAVGVVTILLIGTMGQPILSRFFSSFTLDDASSVNRIELWQTAFKNIIERPFLGTGIGNYAVTILPLADYRTPYYAHNLFLDITVELGLIGLVLILLLFHGAIIGALRGYMKTRDPFTLGLLSAVVLYLAHSIFETALFSVHNLSLLLFIITLAVATESKKPLATME